MIALSDCEDRHIYKLKSRNLILGVFCKASSGFIGIREKFKSEFLFTEYHSDIGTPHGTAIPTKDIDALQNNIELYEAKLRCNKCMQLATHIKKNNKIERFHYDNTPLCVTGEVFYYTNQALFDVLEQIEHTL